MQCDKMQKNHPKNQYRIAGNFSEFETLTIFAIGYENVKE